MCVVGYSVKRGGVCVVGYSVKRGGVCVVGYSVYLLCLATPTRVPTPPVASYSTVNLLSIQSKA